MLRNWYLNLIQVYENVDNIKTVSYVQSMILKCYFGLNYNENIKLIFTDVPVTNEIDYIMNNILKDDKDAKEFFFYSKLNLLFEKYFF